MPVSCNLSIGLEGYDAEAAGVRIFSSVLELDAVSRLVENQREEDDMDERITPSLKKLFLAHFLVAAIVGLQHLLVPRWWTDLTGMEITETVTWRLIGALVLGLAVSSWLAYRERAWERVRIVVVMESVWSYLGVLVLLWGFSFEGLPALELVHAGLLALFAVWFTIELLRARAPAREGSGTRLGRGGSA